MRADEQCGEQGSGKKSRRINLVGSEEFVAAINSAAEAAECSASVYIRAAVVERLQREGFHLEMPLIGRCGRPRKELTEAWMGDAEPVQPSDPV